MFNIHRLEWLLDRSIENKFEVYQNVHKIKETKTTESGFNHNKTRVKCGHNIVG